MMTLQWEASAYQNPKSAQSADVEGGRWYVKRTGKNARQFEARFNGKRVGPLFRSLQEAMAHCEKTEQDRQVRAAHFMPK